MPLHVASVLEQRVALLKNECHMWNLDTMTSSELACCPPRARSEWRTARTPWHPRFLDVAVFSCPIAHQASRGRIFTRKRRTTHKDERCADDSRLRASSDSHHILAKRRRLQSFYKGIAMEEIEWTVRHRSSGMDFVNFWTCACPFAWVPWTCKPREFF